MFERKLPSVPVMRRVLGDTLRGIGVHEDSVADIVLAATEACTNVVLHAGQSASDYTVAATVDQHGCRVEVTDTGEGYRPGGRSSAPAGAPKRSGRVRREMPDPLAESGRGLSIMRACVDAVTLRSAPGQGTRVILTKRVRWDRVGSAA